MFWAQTFPTCRCLRSTPLVCVPVQMSWLSSARLPCHTKSLPHTLTTMAVPSQGLSQVSSPSLYLAVLFLLLASAAKRRPLLPSLLGSVRSSSQKQSQKGGPGSKDRDEESSKESVQLKVKRKKRHSGTNPTIIIGSSSEGELVAPTEHAQSGASVALATATVILLEEVNL